MNPCTECGKWSTTKRQQQCQPWGSETPRIMVVGDAPSLDDDLNGYFFTSQAGRLLSEWITNSGIPADLVRYESLVRCPCPVGKDGPDAETIEACAGHLFGQIDQYKPELIITVGKATLQLFTGRNAITKARGHTYSWTMPEGISDDQYQVLPIINPAAVLRGNKEYETAILADLSFAKEILFGVDRTEEFIFVDTVEAVQELCDRLLAGVQSGQYPYIAVDTETTSLDPWGKGVKFLCYSISAEEGQAYCIPFEYQYGPFHSDKLALETIKGIVRNFLSQVPITGHNIKFDMKWSLRANDADMPNIVFDTMLASWLLYSNTIPHDLEYLASAHAGVHAAKQEMHEALAALPKEKRNMDNVPIPIFNRYSCLDADNTLKLTNIYIKMLHEQGLWECFQTLFVDMIVPFADIEYEGAAFSPGPLDEAREQFEERMKMIPATLEKYGFDKTLIAEKQKLLLAKEVVKKLEARMKTKASGSEEGKAYVKKMKSYLVKSRHVQPPNDLNPNYTYKKTLDEILNKIYTMADAGPFDSQTKTAVAETILKVKSKPVEYSPLSTPEDAAILLYRVFNLPIKEATGAKAASGSKDTVIEAVRDLREWYTADPGWEPVVEFMDLYQEIKGSYKLYTSYLTKLPDFADENSRIHTTYNINATATGRFSSSGPSLHTLPKKSTAKNAFPSRFDGGFILASDFSQIEVRILAIFCNDTHLLQVFREGGDIHRANAARLYNKPPEQVTAEERSNAKAVTFGIVYGQGPEGMADKQHITRAEAEDLIATFYDAFPSIKQWADEQKRYVAEHKCSFTKFGHRRIIPEASSFDRGELGKADRIAVNSPIQGTASQLTSLCLKRIYWRLRHMKMQSKVFGYVHDEVALDVHPDELWQCFMVMKKEMGDAPQNLYPWITIPLDYSFELGMTWGEKIEVVPDFKNLNSLVAEGPSEKTHLLTHGLENIGLRLTTQEENENEDGKIVLNTAYEK